MTDQNAYVNAYIENIMGMVHDQLNQIIQLRTQLKVTEPLLAQKDSAIAELTEKLNNFQNNDTELNAMREKVRITEDSFHALTNKVSHMETLQNQFSDIKKKLIEKEKELEEAKLTIEELKAKKEKAASKKKINTLGTKESVTLELPAVETITETNDF